MPICAHIHALAHVCRRTPNPADTKLAGAAVPGRIPAKRGQLDEVTQEHYYDTSKQAHALRPLLEE